MPTGKLLPGLILAFAATVALAQHNNVPAVQGLPPAARSAAQSIDPARIAAQERFLASDLLEGRGPGTRGDKLAADYIATQFELFGLKPAGDNGTFLQKVPLLAVHTIEDKTKFAFVPASGAPIDLKYGTEIVSKDQTGNPTADFDAPIVYVGYGINAPEYNWNDYAGIDIKGKIALMIVNEPPSTDEKFFNGKALTYYGRWTYKYEEAARRGAVGVILIHRSDLASYGWEVVRNSQAIEKSYLQADPLATLRAAAWIQHDVAEQLFKAAGLGSVDDEIARAGKPGAFHAVELPVRLRAHIESRTRRYDSTNVVAKLSGSALGNVVLYSAHYDHLGIDPDAKGDNIYNGAADNASGCAILIEIARAYAQNAIKPPHDVYFVSVTAEEQGLLGSQYFGEHLPIPARQITLDINYDMVMPLGIPLSVSLAGAERTTFWPQTQSTSRIFDLKISPDPDPSAGHYYRSDHFSLARVGIPAFTIGSGTLFEGHDEAWGNAQFKDFVARHYHQPSDEFDPKGDYRAHSRLAQFGFVLGWLASAQPQSVEWNTGDEFDAPRKKSEAR